MSGHTTKLQGWLDRLAGDDDAAQEEAVGALIAHSMDRLTQLAQRMLRRNPRLARWEQTDDVMQNAMVRLHRALHAIHPESPEQFYRLAATQMRRELIDMARHHYGPEGAARKHHTEGIAAQRTGGGFVENQSAKSSEPVDIEAWSRFHEAVERLSESERDVVNLVWYKGMTQKEAAAILGVTDRTIKNRWRNAKLSLQEMLSDDVPT